MRPTTAQQVADIISAIAKIAWPVAIVVLLLRYRESIQRILGQGQVSKLSLGPVSAEFAAVTEKVEAAASEAGIDDPATADLGSERALVEELARADPRAAVGTSWARVRNATGIAVARRTSERLRSSTVGRLEQLQAHGLLAPQLVDLGRTLKTMETTVLGQPQAEIPFDFARAFSLAAISLAKRVSELIPEGYDRSASTGDPGYGGFGQPYLGSPPVQPYPSYPYPGSSPAQPYPGTSPAQPYPGTSPAQPYPGTSPAQPYPGSSPPQAYPGSSPPHAP